ncbi:OPT/YSL family transporter [Flagellatimonas centrodinii]|uniref:OPT family oligopeptide transporter n=1 Tax=Flagellatimonas centrodinii TaxID=2806210 RepID=UPI001FFAA327|nr:OPT family oligopeptide transporter [Flagellatimonas centrodinii]ULQ46640.1 OPT/YSL family transporter [Flagellatimonas centrodinii]
MNRHSEAREFTRRSLLTGVLIGAVLTPCNVYSGLKIGWSFNMSIVAALLAYGFWNLGARRLGARPFGLLENNINQTTASSAASIISGGLVAPIPALALITGQTLPWHWLAVWVCVVSLLGVCVAVALRRQLLLVEQLSFPAGVATAETVREIYGRGAEAVARVRVLLASLALSGVVKLLTSLGGIAAVPLGFRLAGQGAVAGRTLGGGSLGFAFDPSLLLVGFGAIIGLRAGVSLLLGAVLAWGVMAPWLLARGWVDATRLPDDGFWYPQLVEWLLWPGVALMVAASLTSFVLVLLRRRRSVDRDTGGEVPRPAFWAGFAATLILAAGAQIGLFGIDPVTAVLAVLLAYGLAVVAARVVGETGIPPIGALGKVSQLSFGIFTPANLTANLMTANVAGGAAGQCADLLNDLKTGHLIGATPRLQVLAQLFGILTGSVVGAAAYLVLIPDPQGMLITAEWPAPAVVTWKAVAEVLSGGLSSIPPGAVTAMGVAAVLGILIAASQSLGMGRWLPSAPAAGLAFVIPASNSMSLFFGAVLAALLAKAVPSLALRFTIAVAAGLVAGESLVGVGLALADMVGSG